MTENRSSRPARRRGSRSRGRGHQENDRGRRGPRENRRSAALRTARQGFAPHITYPPQLPVSEHRDTIAAAIRDNQVVIIAGETGSGKTTQIPKICLELGYGIDGMIGHTQPRRIAARAVAARLAEELDAELGGGIGYQVRFTSQVADSTRVKVMTDGILLAELQHDRRLSAYEVIIIDEAHERSLNIDFLLGSLARLLKERPDLKVIITSATIDPESFAAHFDDAPIIRVSGRTYPVEVRYRPLTDDTAASDDDADGPGADGDYEAGAADQTEGILAAVDELLAEPPGDILVFLSGEREIRDTAEALGSHLARRPRTQHWEVIPLFSRLSSAEQQRVFAAHRNPRIVLATNVAETSLTVPGIKYVIDVGTARISRYSNRTKVQRLPIERISQASANQRMGRCGRTSDGICIRLYSADDFASRPEYTDPEILRTNLASVILQMCSLGFARTEADITGFPFLTPPDPRAVRDGRMLLGELGALRHDGDAIRLTGIGRKLARLPIDPRLARMLLAGAEAGCGGEVAVIVAGLSIQDPRERPTEVRAEADALHARFRDEASDFLSLLTLWNHLQDSAATLSSSKFRRLCKAEFINFVRVREWQDLVSQLRSLLGGAGVHIERSRWRPLEEEESGAAGAVGAPAGDAGGGRRGAQQGCKAQRGGKPRGPYDDEAVQIHRALLTGLLSMIGVRTETGRGDRAGGRSGRGERGGPGREYQGARGTRFAIFPGSGLSRSRPEVVVAAELVETSRLWARTVAVVEPEWIIEAAGPLALRRHSEPHWSQRSGSAMAYETVTLYGVTLSSDQRVGYGKIDPVVSRELFIRHALIDGEWRESHAFLRRNAAAIAEAEELASRVRNRRLLAEDEVLFDFYDARLPETVVSGAHFNSWWKTVRQDQPELLDIPVEALLSDDSAQLSSRAAADFPLEWPLPDGTAARLRYAYDPGSTSDGVTVEIPADALETADADAFTWQVPGLRHELVTALIRSLPKAKRRYFVPAPDVASEVLAGLTPYEGRLPEVLAASLTARAGGGELTDLVPITVTADDFDRTRIPPHLVMEFAVMRGDTAVTRDRDLGALRTAVPAPAPAARATRTGFAERTGLTGWTFGELPGPIEQGSVTLHPGLRDDGDAVTLTVFRDADEARRETQRGIVRLLALRQTEALAHVTRELPNADKLVLGAHRTPGHDPLQDAVLAAIAGLPAVQEDGPAVRTEVEFEALAVRVNAEIIAALESTAALVAEILRLGDTLDRAVTKASSLTLLANLADVKDLRADLLAAGFVSATPPAQLRRLPVYLAAALHRVEKMGESAGRDKQLMDRVRAVEASVRTKLTRTIRLEPAPTAQLSARLGEDWNRVLWDLHELRVSLFAPHLGTAHTVSEQRIAKALAKI
ncbi:ATP-dependent RNA helicase HrpA [Brevibacterium sp. R8603A2]|uniref:ATP-dependent RNA helicase HrpA n=1 Tax=Brevibacterium sp. R8603A2 TaxID=2929779 RepID=UPI001FF7FF7A|nr:ATP-dependent RNA helicase HrpA [Brevibacterium sp. R8603A2]MCK1803788.1 ATP-dependent RNA helicase HrpA [Brevibacterium sp. R8603A2]